LGLVLHALVTAANVQDRDGGILLLSTLFGQFPFLRKLFADSAYAGPIFGEGTAKAMRSLVVEIVKRADGAKGFVVEPKRWIVERSIAWLNRCRRLAKDWENRNHNALAFLHLASIRLMVTGAKVRAEADFLLAATRGSSIQPVYEYPAKDIWSIACGIAAARGAAAGRRGRTQACRRRATRGDRTAERLEGAAEH